MTALDKIKTTISIPLLTNINREYFIYTIKYRQNNIVKYILHYHEDKINIVDSSNPAFRYACRWGNIEVVKYLCTMYATMHKSENEYNRKANITYMLNHAFVDACDGGSLEVVKYLCEEYGKIINIADRKNLAFINACRGGYLEVVKYLCEEHGDKINIADQSNEAFISACFWGKIEVVKYLCEYYEEIINIADQENEAFISACISNKTEIVKYLCENYLQTFINNNLQQEYINEAFKLLLNNNIVCDNLVEYIDQNVYEDNIEKIATILTYDTAEYFILTRNLAKRKYDRNIKNKNDNNGETEKLIEKKYQIISYFDCVPPSLLNDIHSKNYEEGLLLVQG